MAARLSLPCARTSEQATCLPARFCIDEIKAGTVKMDASEPSTPSTGVPSSWASERDLDVELAMAMAIAAAAYPRKPLSIVSQEEVDVDKSEEEAERRWTPRASGLFAEDLWAAALEEEQDGPWASQYGMAAEVGLGGSLRWIFGRVAEVAWQAAEASSAGHHEWGSVHGSVVG
mmetsp:Transcript_32614/g.73910  ORF Transcript_32614/g.73910 Transcript_32614/m.73910 type:complete len:174 (-) Transcript_32614:178-699(-)